jgi:molybdenum cofactor cytidylyltransferase
MVSAILLGAGESKRMGRNKLLLPWRGKTLLEHCVDTLLRSKIKEVIVVLSDKSKEMRSPLEKSSFFMRKKLKVTMNPQYRRGMSTSIKKGIQGVDPRSDGILIALGDQPFLKTRTVNALIRAFNQGRGEIIVPSFKKRKGHPVIFHRRFEKELLRLREDVGGKSILQKYSKNVKAVPVKSEGVIKDIDTRKDYDGELRKKS